MKKKKLLLTAIAVALIMTMGIGASWAYFTTYAEAAGEKEVHFGYEADIHEDFDGKTKIVTITSQKGSEPVYVRVRAYTGSQYSLDISGEGWVAGKDGYYYYDKMLQSEQSTLPISIELKNIPAKDVDSANIVVLYETTPVFYTDDGNGNMKPDWDWNMILDKGGDE